MHFINFLEGGGGGGGGGGFFFFGGAEEFCFLEGSLMEKEAVNFWREGMDF